MFRTNEPNGLLLFNGGGNPGKVRTFSESVADFSYSFPKIFFTKKVGENEIPPPLKRQGKLYFP
jgi:hypothetical protein